ncbi:MAG: DUF1588 domain-containing protein [Gammaproteobacteria bacterium]|nr:DUF1588 domain-containing protein [Gammaproteobacteria bacterium]MYF27604.1 DUF1588 domain-containing protein [Gammaproteobacteria bacterium]MYK48123.1 DUF1588 domain-containing protein [Gammaproteobacteria bacterium]
MRIALCVGEGCLRRVLGQALAVTAFGIGVSVWATDAEPDRATLEYEHQRAVGHAAMPSTMYASNPTETPAPHAAMSSRGNLWERLAGDPSRWRFGADDETATDVFRDQISRVVQEKCVTCHAVGGASGHTRLVFHPSSEADHDALNFDVFKDFLELVTDGANLILEKISGGSGHGGGVQVAADSADYAHFERFLALLRDAQTRGLTPETLFDTVRVAGPRKTLRRATLIFAGRVPTSAEYESIAEIGLRGVIRNVMKGDAFHDFLIRGSNDRLLTDGVMDEILPSYGTFVEFTNGRTRRCEIGSAGSSGDFGIGWANRAEQGARRSPLELIAHVVENDLPYTEVLTADYIMANPFAAEAYGANAEFDDESDDHEFKPSRFAAYYLEDGSRSYYNVPRCGSYVTYAGDLRLDYPHAGILNTTTFLKRFPTTPTNRNRARARWTYYHFLGVDVEQLAARTTDPDALADTDNPTMKNPACTGCHDVLDPMAGAFQNYDEDGHYRSNFGGRDSLDHYYKNDPPGADEAVVEADSWELRETVTIRTHLDDGEIAVGLAGVQNPYRRSMGIGGLTVRDDAGRIVARPRLPYDGSDRGCVRLSGDHYSMQAYCGVSVGVDIVQEGFHRISVDTWRRYSDFPAAIKIWGGREFYRYGDTWYRDMREPGFEDALAPSADNSVQWLSQRIVADPRFAEATVKFWWPAIMGTEVAAPPAETGEADYEGRLLAAQAQHAEVARLGELFREGIGDGARYNLKDLLVEIVMSSWFRADSLFDDDPVRAVALRNAGARRLLTPEELAAKTLSLTGVQWGRQAPTYRRRHNHALTTDYAVLYGGIGVDGATERARDLTPVMASVSKLHAVRMSCPIVLRDFYLLPDDQRRLFAGIDHNDVPINSAGERAIKEKLVELFDKLLGVDATSESPEIVSAYEFFVAAWKRRSGSSRFLGESLCEWNTDSYYLEDLPQGTLSEADLSDPRHVARTWVVMLAALLMDYRYIHL